MKTALNIIRSEHRSLAAVIHGLQFLVEQVRKGEPAPDLKVFRAMIHYIDEFPERLHHPKEDRYLFARIMQRYPEGNSIISGLEAQHVHGAQLIRELERALLRWEEEGPSAFPDFAHRVEEFAQFHWQHMREEEDVALPLAERVLLDEDWKAIDAAFEGNQDPLIGKDVQQGFDQLFSHIVNIAPPPIGLGPAPAPKGVQDRK
jgi:hemerythrin-like domain-containing protein